MEEAFKLNFKTKEYEPYELPDGAISLALYSTGYNEVITCAECGKKYCIEVYIFLEKSIP